MEEDELSFDFEQALPTASASAAGPAAGQDAGQVPTEPPIGGYGAQSRSNFQKNYRQTVCTYWLKGLCMKGDTCGFLHKFDAARMPVCRTLLRFGVCKEPDCPYKHTLDDIKECNMYKLGFCVYGPQCRYKHTRTPGPPPDPKTVEAAKPREHRNVSAWVNSVNAGINPQQQFGGPRPGRWQPYGRGPGRGGPRPPMLNGPPMNQQGGMQQLADRPFYGDQQQGPGQGQGPRAPPPQHGPPQPGMGGGPPGYMHQGPNSGGFYPGQAGGVRPANMELLASVGQAHLPYGY
ncbi:hypothetical protein WJX72_003211 [[Myrmecia] bisecta]|uniref:C3H1-type domain-containing protein n=1 Tax=[Myrmecia] bisecta TaxID=41462 RepID=A0AAW1P3B0_9CHLO